MLMLDSKGIAVSTASACASRSLKQSHVLTAIGLPPEKIHASIRLSLGRFNTKEEIKYAIDMLNECVSELRRISPFGG